MYKTGNLQKNIKSLESLLKKVKYKDKLEMSMVEAGDPRVFLPILNYIFLDFSPIIASLLNNNNYELFSKSDREFVKTSILALINLFNYRPALSADQFFKSGFAEGKTIFCCEVISIILKEHDKLEKKVNSMNKPGIGIEHKSFHNKALSYSNLCNSNLTEKHAQERYNQEDSTMIKEIRSLKKNEEYRVHSIEDINQRTSGRDNYMYNSDSPKFASHEVSDNNAYSNYQVRYDEEEDENNYLRVQPVKVECNKALNNQNVIHNLIDSASIKSPPNERSRNGEIEELIEIINTLASSVKDMTGRVDSFKLMIEKRLTLVENDVKDLKQKFTNIEAENTVLRNEIILMSAGKGKSRLPSEVKSEKLDKSRELNVQTSDNNSNSLYNFKKLKSYLEQQENCHEEKIITNEVPITKRVETIENKEHLQDDDRLFSFAHNTLANEERSVEKGNWKAQSNNTIISDYEFAQDSINQNTIKEKNYPNKKTTSFSDKLSKIELHFKTTSDMLKDLK